MEIAFLILTILAYLVRVPAAICFIEEFLNTLKSIELIKSSYDMSRPNCAILLSLKAALDLFSTSLTAVSKVL